VNLRREARWLRPIGLIMVIAIACGGYILNKQRLESPLRDRYALHFEFNAVDAVTPGLGAPITVAGVQVGQIDAVRLEDGRGVLRASMEPDELAEIYKDARAALVPNTPLKDMQVRLQPGSPRAGKLGEGGRVKLRNTTSPVDADELLRALDGDTRAWVQSLMHDLGTGFEGRGRTLNATLKTLGPTAAQTRRITSLLAQRRRQIPKLVHNLRRITDATAAGDGDIERLVDTGNATLATLAQNDEPLKATLAALPPTLDAARTTLRKTPAFTASLTEALEALEPSIRTSRATLRETPGALKGVVPLPVADLKRFVDALAPIAEPVRAGTRDLGEATPSLREAFRTLGRTTNRLASAPKDGSKSNLFWFAWFAHNVGSTLTTGDAHGAVARGLGLFSCGSFNGSAQLAEVLEQVVPGGTSACQGEGGG
jgi:phospholipid/cholesterol/gamma-HCH transport system substrate-binding protein